MLNAPIHYLRGTCVNSTPTPTHMMSETAGMEEILIPPMPQKPYTSNTCIPITKMMMFAPWIDVPTRWSALALPDGIIRARRMVHTMKAARRPARCGENGGLLELYMKAARRGLG